MEIRSMNLLTKHHAKHNSKLFKKKISVKNAYGMNLTEDFGTIIIIL